VLLPTRSAAQPVAGRVVAMDGTPTLTRNNTNRVLRRDDRISTGDLIETDTTARAKLLLADDSILDIGPQSRIKISEFRLSPDDRHAQLNVLAGRFKLAVAKFFGERSRYQVFMPTAVAGVRGTVLWGDTSLDLVCALDGSIEVRAIGGEGQLAEIRTGHCASQMASGKIVSVTPSREELLRYLRDVTID